MARLSPGRVRTVKAVPTIRPPRWNGLKPTQPASRARLSDMTDVGAFLNASISVAFGFATSVAAMVMVMLPPSLRQFVALDQDGTAMGRVPTPFLLDQP